MFVIIINVCCLDWHINHIIKVINVINGIIINAISDLLLKYQYIMNSRQVQIVSSDQVVFSQQVAVASQQVTMAHQSSPHQSEDVS